jgi:hypothetical protein
MQQIDSKKSRGLAFSREQQADPRPRHSLPPALPLPNLTPATPTPDIPPQTVPRKRGRPRKSLVDSNGNTPNTSNGSQARPLATKQPRTPALAYKTGYGDEARREQTRQHYEQYIAYRGRAPPAQVQNGFEYVSHLKSEAQVRIALDSVEHSQGNVSMKQRHIAALFHRLEEVRMQSGTRQS